IRFRDHKKGFIFDGKNLFLKNKAKSSNLNVILFKDVEPLKSARNSYLNVFLFLAIILWCW
ncbi:hypothetical protein, partial [Providencia rustigianii]